MRKIIFLAGLVLLNSINVIASEDWGETGHRVTGEIAENHLNNKAKRAIRKLLDGESLAFVSTYADEIRSDDNLPDYSAWHYVNFPFGQTYEATPKSEKGDIITAINKCILILRNSSSMKEEKVFYLKLLVHFIGDLHQPLHVGMAEDRGGNKFQVQWFGDGTNLHRVWDSQIIESYNMSYSELVANANSLSKEQIAAIQQGPVAKWMYESRELCEKVYADTKSGEDLSYKYRYIYMPVIRERLQQGGIRLAGMLNEIFG
jgi:hypothetical protein